MINVITRGQFYCRCLNCLKRRAHQQNLLEFRLAKTRGAKMIIIIQKDHYN